MDPAGSQAVRALFAFDVLPRTPGAPDLSVRGPSRSGEFPAVGAVATRYG